MKDIIAIKYNLNTQRDYLKLKLEQKELVEFNNWKSKEENINNREAMDKTIARIFFHLLQNNCKPLIILAKIPARLPGQRPLMRIREREDAQRVLN